MQWLIKEKKNKKKGNARKWAQKIERNNPNAKQTQEN